jgi:xanthine dehydrogenase accessory factor
MIAWIDTLDAQLSAGTPVMMVTVVASAGSVPREAGTRMLVREDGFDFTVGGGQLEFEALAEARALLSTGGGACLHTFTLGPDLGQCCGGSATMLFEPFSPADSAWVANLKQAAGEPEPVARLVSLSAEGSFSRDLCRSRDALDADVAERMDKAARASSAICAEVSGNACRLVEFLRDDRRPVWLFGAGHVGRAIAQTLAPLPFQLTWIDSRKDEFPADVPAGVTTFWPSMPDLLIDDAPQGTMFLVMTHSHATDQDICEAVLRRGDAAYLGLIGSKTKRGKFQARFRAKGLDDATIAQMTCPIGLAGLSGKEPAVIAASVAADLLVRNIASTLDQSATLVSGDGLNV